MDLEEEVKKVELRKQVWSIASELVDDILEDESLEEYRSGSPFSYTTTTTTMDQHVAAIQTVADWLLGET